MPLSTFAESSTVSGIQGMAGSVIQDKTGSKWQVITPSSFGSAIEVKPLKKAFGGLVSGLGNSYSDSIHAMLSHGEYVVSAQAVKNLGVSKLDAINAGRLPTSAPSMNMTNHFNIDIQGAGQDAKDIAKMVVNDVMNKINVTFNKNNKSNLAWGH